MLLICLEKSRMCELLFSAVSIITSLVAVQGVQWNDVQKERVGKETMFKKKGLVKITICWHVIKVVRVATLRRTEIEVCIKKVKK